MAASFDPDRTRRVMTGAIVLAIHGAMGAALLFALAGRDFPSVQREDVPLVTNVPLPPPPPPPRERPRPATHKSSTAAAAAPRAQVRTTPPPPSLIAVPAPVPAPPPQPNGTGTGGGLGGVGNGTGSGGNGAGDGDGFPPERIAGRITGRDFPHALSDAGIGGTVGVRYRVNVDGRVSDCIVTRSSGNAQLDALTCDLVQRRFRFRPARDADGRPVRSSIVENHSWIIPSAEPPGHRDEEDDSD